MSSRYSGATTVSLSPSSVTSICRLVRIFAIVSPGISMPIRLLMRATEASTTVCGFGLG